MRSNPTKRRELRKLESRRDDLMIKRDKVQQELAQTRAALKKRRGQAT